MFKFVSLLFLLISKVCWSTQFIPVSPDLQSKESDLLVVGTVIGENFSNLGNKLVTITDLKIDNAWGWENIKLSYDKIQIHQSGGHHNNVITTIEGSPKFYPGEKIAVFLNEIEGKFWVHNLSLGVFDIKQNEQKEEVVTNRAFPHNSNVGNGSLENFTTNIVSKMVHLKRLPANDNKSSVEIQKVVLEKDGLENKVSVNQKTLRENPLTYVVVVIFVIITLIVTIRRIKKNKYSTLVVLIFFVGPELIASVFNLTSVGTKIKWPSSSVLFNLYVDTTNNDALDQDEVFGVIQSATSEWAKGGNISIITTEMDTSVVYPTDSTLQITSSVIYGSGVLGYTELSYTGSTGKIIKGDIYINDNYDFSLDATDTDSANLTLVYLGDVVTHEIGHLLGLSHSQTKESTMFYSILKGQSTVSEEDMSGIANYYPKTTNYALSGKVVGGDDVVGIFGAYVQAISYQTGTVAGSALSDSDGSFSIGYLNKDYDYFILVQPVLSKTDLPTYYNSIQTNFCAGGTFSPSFFQPCGTSSIGYPHAFNFDSGQTLNVGNVTIRCSQPSPQNYIANKEDASPSGFDLDGEVTSGKFGNAFVGFFNDYEKDSNDSEVINLDFTNYSSVVSGDYIELRINAQKYFSTARMAVSVERGDGSITTDLNINTDSEDNLDTSHLMYIPLSTTAADNTFEITLTAENLISSLETYDELEFFPNYEDYAQAPSYYLFTSRIVNNSSGSYAEKSQKYFPTVKDNSTCTDGPFAYAMPGYTTKEDLLRKKNRASDGLALGCGTIEGPSGPNSPGALFLSFSLGLLLVSLIGPFLPKHFRG